MKARYGSARLVEGMGIGIVVEMFKINAAEPQRMVGSTAAGLSQSVVEDFHSQSRLHHTNTKTNTTTYIFHLTYGHSFLVIHHS
jgi:hypothetical protein